MLISIITMFFTGYAVGFRQSCGFWLLYSVHLLCSVSVMTFLSAFAVNTYQNAIEGDAFVIYS